MRGPYGRGWGRIKPREIYNGGVPSGLVKRIRWRAWGKIVASGRGWGYQYRPGGGYYAKPVRVEFKATRMDACPGIGRPAYTRLLARVQKRPGGSFDDWFNWDLDLCNADAQAFECPIETPDAPATLELTAWDADCTSALAVAEEVGWSAPRATYGDDVAYWRASPRGYKCRGYTYGEDTTISWSCLRWTSQLHFVTAIWW